MMEHWPPSRFNPVIHGDRHRDPAACWPLVIAAIRRSPSPPACASAAVILNSHALSRALPGAAHACLRRYKHGTPNRHAPLVKHIISTVALTMVTKAVPLPRSLDPSGTWTADPALGASMPAPRYGEAARTVSGAPAMLEAIGASRPAREHLLLPVTSICDAGRVMTAIGLSHLLAIIGDGVCSADVVCPTELSPRRMATS